MVDVVGVEEAVLRAVRELDSVTVEVGQAVLLRDGETVLMALVDIVDPLAVVLVVGLKEDVESAEVDTVENVEVLERVLVMVGVDGVLVSVCVMVGVMVTVPLAVGD